MKPNKQPILFIAFAAILAFLVINAGVSYWNTRRLESNDLAVTHTRDVLLRLEGLLVTVQDLEIGRRGYLLTGEPRYLDPYNESLALVKDSLSGLKKLVADSPRQQQRVQELERLLNEKIGELGETIQLLQEQGLGAVVPIIISGRGRQLLDAIRSTLLDMKDEERIQLREREADSQAALLQTLISIGALFVIAVVSVMLLYRSTWRHFAAQEEAARLLHDQRELLQTTLASIGDAVITTDANGRVNFLNPVAEALTAWSREQAIGQPIERVLPVHNDSTGEPITSPVLKAAARDEVVGSASHNVLISRDGREIPIDDNSAPIKNTKGELVGMVLVFRDITERKQAEEEREGFLQRERLARARSEASATRERFLSEATQVLVSSLEPNTMLTRFAELAVPMLGDLCFFDVVKNDRIQRVAWTHVDPQQRQLLSDIGKTAPPLSAAHHPIIKALTTGEPVLQPKVDDAWLQSIAIGPKHLEFMRRFPLCSQMTVPLVTGSHQIGALTFCFADSGRHHTREDLALGIELGRRVTVALQQANLYQQSLERLQRLEESQAALRRATRAADQASRAKSEFLANMSHEIRTPITAIMGFADVLLVQNQNLEYLESVQTIKRNAQYLVEIINDILDVSKIEANKLDIEIKPCSPQQIVNDVHSLVLVRAQEKGIALSVNYDGPIPTLIESDETRVRQILINLVGNAIKFTDEGSVDLRVRLLQDADQPLLQFEVEDTGIGIAEEQLPRLFQPFSQADGSVARRFGGSGLGLVISKRLAEMLGGEISVSSELGVGSTFQATVATGALTNVPLVEAKVLDKEGEADSSKEQAPIKLDCRVLVADDHRDIRQLIRRIVEDAGGEVTTANDGRTAISLIQREERAGAGFDVVLMDMQMPLLDGYHVVSRLRADGYCRPIIALTASAMKGDREKCLQAGCDDYMAKPVNGRHLLELIDHYCKVSSTRTMGAKRDDPLRVLVVDDSAATTEAMKMLLETYGYSVSVAYNGEQALAMAKSIQPQVVLMDIDLPDLSGYQVVAALRAIDALENTVFIAVSGYEEDPQDQRSQQALFHHYVIKPAAIADLVKLFPKSSTD